MRDPNQKTMLPTRVITNKITAPSQDFSGQDSGYPSGSPEEEVGKNRDGGSAGVNFQFVPSSDDQSKEQKLTVFQATDPKLHTDASYRPGDGREDGTPPVSHETWRGPHPRGT